MFSKVFRLERKSRDDRNTPQRPPSAGEGLPNYYPLQQATFAQQRRRIANPDTTPEAMEQELDLLELVCRSDSLHRRLDQLQAKYEKMDDGMERAQSQDGGSGHATKIPQHTMLNMRVSKSFEESDSKKQPGFFQRLFKQRLSRSHDNLLDEPPRPLSALGHREVRCEPLPGRQRRSASEDLLSSPRERRAGRGREGRQSLGSEVVEPHLLAPPLPHRGFKRKRVIKMYNLSPIHQRHEFSGSSESCNADSDTEREKASPTNLPDSHPPHINGCKGSHSGGHLASSTSHTQATSHSSSHSADLGASNLGSSSQDCDRWKHQGNLVTSTGDIRKPQGASQFGNPHGAQSTGDLVADRWKPGPSFGAQSTGDVSRRAKPGAVTASSSQDGAERWKPNALAVPKAPVGRRGISLGEAGSYGSLGRQRESHGHQRLTSLDLDPNRWAALTLKRNKSPDDPLRAPLSQPSPPIPPRTNPPIPARPAHTPSPTRGGSPVAPHGSPVTHVSPTAPTPSETRIKPILKNSIRRHDSERHDTPKATPAPLCRSGSSREVLLTRTPSTPRAIPRSPTLPHSHSYSPHSSRSPSSIFARSGSPSSIFPRSASPSGTLSRTPSPSTPVAKSAPAAQPAPPDPSPPKTPEWEEHTMHGRAHPFARSRRQQRMRRSYRQEHPPRDFSSDEPRKDLPAHPELNVSGETEANEGGMKLSRREYIIKAHSADSPKTPSPQEALVKTPSWDDRGSVQACRSDPTGSLNPPQHNPRLTASQDLISNMPSHAQELSKTISAQDLANRNSLDLPAPIVRSKTLSCQDLPTRQASVPTRMPTSASIKELDHFLSAIIQNLESQLKSGSSLSISSPRRSPAKSDVRRRFKKRDEDEDSVSEASDVGKGGKKEGKKEERKEGGKNEKISEVPPRRCKRMSECGSCGRRWVEPRLLPCLHTVCTPCLHTLSTHPTHTHTPTPSRSGSHDSHTPTHSLSLDSHTQKLTPTNSLTHSHSLTHPLTSLTHPPTSLSYPPTSLSYPQSSRSPTSTPLPISPTGRSTPVHPSTPTGRSGTPIAHPSTPTGRPVTPIPHPSTPTDRSTPVSRSFTPVQHPSTPDRSTPNLSSTLSHTSSTRSVTPTPIQSSANRSVTPTLRASTPTHRSLTPTPSIGSTTSSTLSTSHGLNLNGEENVINGLPGKLDHPLITKARSVGTESIASADDSESGKPSSLPPTHDLDSVIDLLADFTPNSTPPATAPRPPRSTPTPPANAPRLTLTPTGSPAPSAPNTLESKSKRSSSTESMTRARGVLVVWCPECGYEAEVPPGGVECFPLNYVLQKQLVLDALNSDSTTVYCDLCHDEVVAEERCETCPVNLCHLCGTAHTRQRRTTSHKVITLEEARSVGIREVAHTLVCSTHGEGEVGWWCRGCQEPLCATCLATLHRGHNTATVTHEAPHIRATLTKLLSAASARVDELLHAVEELAGAGVSVETKGRNVGDEVNAFVDDYILALEHHRTTLLHQVRQACERAQRGLVVESQRVGQTASWLRQGCDLTHDLLHHAGDAETLALSPVLMARLQSLLKEGVKGWGRWSRLALLPDHHAGRVRGHRIQGVIADTPAHPTHSRLKPLCDVGTVSVGCKVVALVVVRDEDGQPITHGGEHPTANLTTSTGSHLCGCCIRDREDGSYEVVCSPPVSGTSLLNVTIQGTHIQGSPLELTVTPAPATHVGENAKEPTGGGVGGGRRHTGVYHCCTFCSSGGDKNATCGCGGTMPGGYHGCGHNHAGHPGHKHWSCCGLTSSSAPCTRPPSQYYHVNL